MARTKTPFRNLSSDEISSMTTLEAVEERIAKVEQRQRQLKGNPQANPPIEGALSRALRKAGIYQRQAETDIPRELAALNAHKARLNGVSVVASIKDSAETMSEADIDAAIAALRARQKSLAGK